jgi:uncharacterized protein (DUF1697 family)
MAELRVSCERLGYENIKTYINSGNVIFDAASPGSKEIASRIHDAILKDFGLDISVMVRSAEEMRHVAANNPFDGQFDNHKDMHVFFLAGELPDDKRAQLMEKHSDAEQIAVDGRTIYYLLRISIIDSSLGKGFLDKKLKVPATARNWRTVKTLAEM